MTDAQTVLVEVVDHVAWVRLNRPAVRNAMNRDMGVELFDALRSVTARHDVRCLVLTGVDDTAFCAGADIARLRDEGAGDTAMLALHFMRENMHGIVRAIYDAPYPAIAFVAGPAVGAGMSLALACDLIVAHDNARFSQAFVKMGIMPDLGSLHTLPARIGLHRAKELMLTGRMLKAAEAYEFGFVNEVVAAADWERRKSEWVSELASLPPEPIAAIKRALHGNIHQTMDATLEYEAMAQTLLRGTADHAEAIKAFFEKRKPVWGKA